MPVLENTYQNCLYCRHFCIKWLRRLMFLIRVSLLVITFGLFFVALLSGCIYYQFWKSYDVALMIIHALIAACLIPLRKDDAFFQLARLMQYMCSDVRPQRTSPAEDQTGNQLAPPVVSDGNESSASSSDELRPSTIEDLKNEMTTTTTTTTYPVLSEIEDEERRTDEEKTEGRTDEEKTEGRTDEEKTDDKEGNTTDDGQGYGFKIRFEKAKEAAQTIGDEVGETFGKAKDAAEHTITAPAREVRHFRRKHRNTIKRIIGSPDDGPLHSRVLQRLKSWREQEEEDDEREPAWKQKLAAALNLGIQLLLFRVSIALLIGLFDRAERGNFKGMNFVNLLSGLYIQIPLLWLQCWYAVIRQFRLWCALGCARYYLWLLVVIVTGGLLIELPYMVIRGRTDPTECFLAVYKEEINSTLCHVFACKTFDGELSTGPLAIIPTN